MIWQKTDPSLLIGASVGLQVMLSRVAGLMLELGWHHRFFGEAVVVEGTTPAGATRLEGDVDYNGGQVTMSAGPLFAF